MQLFSFFFFSIKNGCVLHGFFFIVVLAYFSPFSQFCQYFLDDQKQKTKQNKTKQKLKNSQNLKKNAIIGGFLMRCAQEAETYVMGFPLYLIM